MSSARLTPRLLAVYSAVKNAGPAGAMCHQVRDALPDLSSRSVQALLTRLLRAGLASQVRSFSPYVANELPAAVGLVQTLRARCLEAVAECPGGIADGVLAADLNVSVKQVRRALELPLQRGTVVRINMPGGHGGGKGYCTPAAQDTGELDPADIAGNFDLRDQRLALAFDDVRIVLPRAVTRGLFRYLDTLQGAPQGKAGAA